MGEHKRPRRLTPERVAKLAAQFILFGKKVDDTLIPVGQMFEVTYEQLWTVIKAVIEDGRTQGTSLVTTQGEPLISGRPN